MLDAKILRESPSEVLSVYRERLFDEDAAKLSQEALGFDEKRRNLLREADELKNKRNSASQTIGREKDPEKRAALIKEMESVKADISRLDAQLVETETQLNKLLLELPNLPDAEVPTGRTDAENRIVRTEGKAFSFDFSPKPHWELGEALGILDFERGVKLSGSRFYLLKGAGARLQHAVIQFMLDMHVQKHGYTEIYPPFIVRSVNFETAGQLPKFYDNIYRDAEEDFMLLGTAEIALTNVHRDEILEEAELPIKYVAYTPCFRREKMSAGKDVRGIKRGHQFDKVEMYRYTTPETSFAALEEMKQEAIDICEALGFPYRVLELATGDISYASVKTYDIEVWAAGCGEWLEVSSASNCTDFQARRANVKYRPAEGGKTRIVHTLNASGLALPRVMIALMENNQQADGSIVVPEALRPYMGGIEVIR